MRFFALRTSVCAAVVLALLELTSCAPTQVKSTTTDSAFKPRDMHKILVLVLVRKPSNQRLLEDEFVRRLTRKGTEAVAGYTLVREGESQDEAAWKKLIQDNQFDSVIVSRLTQMDVEQKESDPSSDPKFLKGPSSFGYYSYRYVYQPAYDAVPEQTAKMETRIFQMPAEKMMWSAVSETDIVWGRDPEAQVQDFVRLMLSKIYS